MWCKQKGLLSCGPEYCWFSSSCLLKRKLHTVTSACMKMYALHSPLCKSLWMTASAKLLKCKRNLVQVINQPTWVFTNTTRLSTCIDHICTNTVELCSKAVSIPIGCSDHSIVAIAKKAKVPKAGPKIVYKRSHRRFCCHSYVDDVKKIFVSLMWLIRGIQRLHLIHLWNCFFQLLLTMHL